MGIQCHVQLKDILPVMHNISIDKEHYESGGGDDQNQPWYALVCRVLMPCGVLIYANMSDDCASFWFDANHWGDNRYQVDALRLHGVPFIES
jgi:hypothetical protein